MWNTGYLCFGCSLQPWILQIWKFSLELKVGKTVSASNGVFCVHCMYYTARTTGHVEKITPEYLNISNTMIAVFVPSFNMSCWCKRVRHWLDTWFNLWARTQLQPSISSRSLSSCYVCQCYMCIDLKGCLGVRCRICRCVGAPQYTMLIFGFPFFGC